MNPRPAIPLTSTQITLGSPDFDLITGWPFPDPFVARLLRHDLAQWVQFWECRLWAYRNPAGEVVGFGTLAVCDVWAEYTNGRAHPYIPLLAANPTIKSLGYRTSIVRHLIDEAALLVHRPGGCYDNLLLDVYLTSAKAIQVYTDCGFRPVNPTPIPDPDQGGDEFMVMAIRVSTASP